MIVLFTDFSLTGPYVGEMKAVLEQRAPDVPVIDLMHDAPSFDAKASAYLFAALVGSFPAGSIFVCVVDPGVGSTRDAVMLEADGRWYVGPDNGLLALVTRRAKSARWWRITWQPEALSASFHGRDLFAPVVARLAQGRNVPGEPNDTVGRIGGDRPDELAEVIYLDHFGNAMTGMRAASLGPEARLAVAGHTLDRARIFSDVPKGVAFWYENANGLAEIAVNSGRAEAVLNLSIGMNIEVK